MPLACPHIGQVLQYDQAMRDLQARLMKGGMDFKAALEASMADSDTRTLHFTTAFGMEAHTAPCRALTAPGLNEIYANLPRGQKRNALSDAGGGAQSQEVSAAAKKRARVAEKKKKAQADSHAHRAIAAPPAALAIENGRPDKKAGKGGKEGKGKAIPKGIKSQTAEGKRVCFAYRKGDKCVQEPSVGGALESTRAKIVRLIEQLIRPRGH